MKKDSSWGIKHIQNYNYIKIHHSLDTIKPFYDYIIFPSIYIFNVTFF